MDLKRGRAGCDDYLGACIPPVVACTVLRGLHKNKIGRCGFTEVIQILYIYIFYICRINRQDLEEQHDSGGEECNVM